MARFCARVRKRPDVPSVSMKDIYHHRPIQSLATPLATTRAPEGTFAEVLAEVMRVDGCRWTATSSTTSAPTRW